MSEEAAMQTVTSLVIPFAVALLMWVVGLELSPRDFRRLAERPGTVAAATVGQIVALPLIAGVAIVTLRPAESIVAGLILIAAAPGAPISNLLVYLARGGIALSVTLTAITNTIGVLTYPLLAAVGFQLYIGERTELEIPVGTMIAQLALLVLLPIAVGMAVRARRPGFVERHRTSLKRASMFVVAAIVAFIVYDQGAAFATQLVSAAWFSAFLTVSAMAIGFATGWLLGTPFPDRVTLLVQFSARNTALAIVIAATTLGRLDYAMFIVAYFVVQMGITAAVLALLVAGRGEELALK